jgi:prolyl-tRNA synthetase
MLYSTLLGKSLRNVSSQILTRGHALLTQAGFVRESSAGRFYLLPLGMRVQRKICRIVEQEMDRAGAQRIHAPILHPLELWRETNRDQAAAFELMQVKDRRGGSFVLGGTAEEMMVDLARRFDLSYRDLPFNIYQFSEKFRDELRVRGGLLRTREFLMKDAYSFHRDRADFENHYELMAEAYTRIFSRLGLRARMVEADNGYMGGDYCHEFVVDHELGESRYLVSEDGARAAHEDVAAVRHQEMNAGEELLPMRTEKAERGASVEEGVRLYGQPAWRQIKSVVYKSDSGEWILAAIRGDLRLNELKLCRAAGCRELRMATEEERRILGSCVGFVSPLKLKVRRIGDLSLQTVRTFYTGADEFQRDTLNVNYGRDFEMDLLADIALAESGHHSLKDGGVLEERRGIEVGNIFQLGTYYTERMDGATFVTDSGAREPYYMGCYGIGIDRTLATIAEIYHDEKGLLWPQAAAPFDVHLVVLGDDSTVRDNAWKLYRQLSGAGIEVLFDEREESAGVKFADADLIGIPNRITVSKKTVSADVVELKGRAETTARLLEVNSVLESLRLAAK